MSHPSRRGSLCIVYVPDAAVGEEAKKIIFFFLKNLGRLLFCTPAAGGHLIWTFVASKPYAGLWIEMSFT